MAIKDKIKKAAQAIKKDEPTPAPASTSAQPTPVPTPAKTSASAQAAPPAKAKTSAPPTSIQIPAPSANKSSNGHANGNGTGASGLKTPKTPQDEAIAFFSSGADGQPVQVWELWLEDDGGPGDNKSVSTFMIETAGLAE